jgi:fucose permease
MKWSLILFSYFSLFLFGLIDNSRGPLYPEILSFFNLTNSQGSLLFSLSSGFGFVVTIFSGTIFKIFGVNNSVKISVGLLIISTFIYGYFAGAANSFHLFLLGSVFLGLSVGLLSVGNNLIISRNVEDDKKQMVFSGLHAMYGLASFGAPLALSFYLGSGQSWHSFFFVLSICAVIIFLVFLPIKNDSFTPKVNSTIHVNKKTSFRLGSLISLYVSSEILVSTRMVIYINEVWSVDPSKSALFLSFFFLFLLIGRLSFAFIKIKFDELTLLKISSSLSIISIVLGMWIHPFFLSLCGLSMSYFFPCILGWVSKTYQDKADELIPMMMKFVNGMIVIIHGVFGIVSDAYGIKVAFSLGFIFQLIVLYLLQKQSTDSRLSASHDNVSA